MEGFEKQKEIQEDYVDNHVKQIAFAVNDFSLKAIDEKQLSHIISIFFISVPQALPLLALNASPSHP